MLKRTIEFTDFNGNTRKEDFYFHLNKAELTELEFSHNGGLTTMFTRVVSEQDAPTIMQNFKDIIRKSYGKKSDDGRRFLKSDEISRDFMETEAYSILFMELLTDTDKAIAFVNGIVPEDMRQAMEDQQAKEEEEAKKQAAAASLPPIHMDEAEKVVKNSADR